MKPTEETLTSEAQLAAKLDLPRKTFVDWRKAGALKFPQHFITKGRGEIMLTPEGVAEVERLLSHQPGSLQTPDAGERASIPSILSVKILGASANPRRLRAQETATGQPCSVVLIAPRVFARQFQKGRVIEVRSTALPFVHEYAGTAAKRRGI
jgi:hypothetical protein